jgi:hypothetical protein
MGKSRDVVITLALLAGVLAWAVRVSLLGGG